MVDIFELCSSVDFISNFLFAFVGIVFGYFLYKIERGATKNQDETLDIILDQVSKVK